MQYEEDKFLGLFTKKECIDSANTIFVSPMDLLPNNVRKKCLTEIS